MGSRLEILDEPLRRLLAVGLVAILLGLLGAMAVDHRPAAHVLTVTEVDWPKHAVAATAINHDQSADVGHTRSGLPAPSRDAVRSALQSGVAAAAPWGTVGAAIQLDGWASPVSAGPVKRHNRMWSMSKAVTAVTLLAKLREQGTAVGAVPNLRSDLAGALERSENCRQRRIVLDLQRAARGSQAARQAFLRTLDGSGASAQVPPAAVTGDGECTTVNGFGAAFNAQPALQLGTSTWTVVDAVRFMYQLRASDAAAQSGYGRPGRQVLAILRHRKADSTENPGQNPYTTGPEWGAGLAFGFDNPYHVAYKAGWGGSRQHHFIAGQIIAIDLPHGHWASIALSDQPSRQYQPETDDPGAAKADRALAAVLKPIKKELEHS